MTTHLILKDITDRKDTHSWSRFGNGYDLYFKLKHKRDGDYIRVQDILGIQTNLIDIDKKFKLSLPYSKSNRSKTKNRLYPELLHYYNFELIHELNIKETIISKTKSITECKTEVIDSIVRIKLKEREDRHLLALRHSFDEHEDFVKEYILYEGLYSYDTNKLLLDHFDRVIELKKMFYFAADKFKNIIDQNKKEKKNQQLEIKLEINKSKESNITSEILTEDYKGDPKICIAKFKVNIPE